MKKNLKFGIALALALSVGITQAAFAVDGATTAGTTTVGGNGGIGFSNSITGSSITYAGGGGGGTFMGGTLGTGGAGGGGGATVAGTNGLGGGGGGPINNFSNGGAGGSGTVIIRYTGGTGLATVVGGTSSTVGNDTVWTFTGNGSFTDKFSSNLTVNGGSIVFGGAVGASAPLSAMSFTSTNSLTLPSINAANIFARTTGANSDITIPLGRVLTATAAGNAITLAAGRNVINNSGAGVFSTPSGRWLMYLPTENTSTLGGLTVNFAQYGCPYATCGLPATGNGILYAFNSSPVGGGTIGLGAAPNPVDPVVITPTIDTPLVNTPVAPTIPIQTVIATQAPALPPITQGDKSNIPITVERISIDPTPMMTALTFEGPVAFRSITTARNESLMTQDTSSTPLATEVNAEGEAQPTTAAQDSEGRSLSVWEGLLTISPELARVLGLDAGAWQ